MKLLRSQIEEINRLYIAGAKQQELAEQFGVSQHLIHKVVTGGIYHVVRQATTNELTFEEIRQKYPQHANRFRTFRYLIKKRRINHAYLYDTLRVDKLEKLFCHIDKGDLITRAEAAMMLGLTRERIRQLVADNTLREISIGHSKYVYAIDVKKRMQQDERAIFSQSAQST